jgi:hypothetical protein
MSSCIFEACTTIIKLGENFIPYLFINRGLALIIENQFYYSQSTGDYINREHKRVSI